jgi:hypothetical protein
VRSVLGKPPLWLGEQFRGHRLRFVQVGKTGIPAKGKIARAASFVRFDYGIVRVDEFGDARPFWFVKAPAPARGIVSGPQLALGRNGLLVVVERGDFVHFPLDSAFALELARALRPFRG